MASFRLARGCRGPFEGGDAEGLTKASGGVGPWVGRGLWEGYLSLRARGLGLLGASRVVPRTPSPGGLSRVIPLKPLRLRLVSPAGPALPPRPVCSREACTFCCRRGGQVLAVPLCPPFCWCPPLRWCSPIRWCPPFRRCPYFRWCLHSAGVHFCGCAPIRRCPPFRWCPPCCSAVVVPPPPPHPHPPRHPLSFCSSR